MLPVFVALRAGTGGIDKDCVIDAGHLQTVAQPALGRRLGVMPPAIMEQLNRALARSLGIR